MLKRIRFQTDSDDPRPVKWPIKHPYWITGEAGDGSYSTIVAYADNEGYIYEHWPEAAKLEVAEVEGYQFTSRFPEPDWFKEQNA